MFKKFREAGLVVIPLRDGIPAIKWGEVTETDLQWPETGDYALVCGAVSNVIALDIDSDEVAERVYQLAGETPVRKKGSKGFTAFYKFNGELSTNWKREGDKAPLVELLSNKRLTTIPPSRHRVTGKKYEWMDKIGLLDCEDLPTLRPDFFIIMNALYPRPVFKPSTSNLFPHEDVSFSEAEEMLSYLSSDTSRDEWLQIGMALRDEFGDVACELWHQWSSNGSSSYSYRDAQACWRSFTGEGVTIGSLVYKAKQAGWMRRNNNEPVGGFDVDLSYLLNPTAKPITKPLTVHGLVGEIAEWITSTAIFPQPVLSLAAALAFVGMLKGHRIRGYTNLRTNLLIMSLAPTASGKEHPQNCIKRLVRDCGLESNLMGEPTSGTGFLRSVHDRGRVALMVMDEIGRYLGNASGKMAGSHQKEIIDYIIKTFSNANSVLKGREYADNKKNPTIDINQPHFCCLGSTVEERLKAACTSSEIVDGFLNRWIVMGVRERVARREKVKFAEPPRELVERIQSLAAREYNHYTADPILREVRFTPEAWDYFNVYRREMDKKIEATPYPLNALYARTAEHVEKLALTISDSEDVLIADVKAAIEIVTYSNISIMHFAGLISDNEQEGQFVKVRELIKEVGTIRRNELTRKTQFIIGGERRRNEILEALIGSGEVSFEKDDKGVVTFTSRM
jgi:hypothetical protein